MIIHVKKSVSKKKLQDFLLFYNGVLLEKEDKFVIITSSKFKKLEKNHKIPIDDVFSFETDIQLASRDYQSKKRQISLPNLNIGGHEDLSTVIMAGPCSVESEEQMELVATFLKKLNVKILRGGCFKPRTSPYTFQGLGTYGLEILQKIKAKYDFTVITEVKDATHVHHVIESTDIIQIGAKAMYDHGILKACGKSSKPVLIKRGFGTSLKEFVQAAEFILSRGNPNVMLCERGIRTFVNETRFTLDLCGIAYLKKFTNLPIVIDPSHAMGKSYGVADLARASIAMGVDGLMIEVHPNPSKALSDAEQQLNFEEFQSLFNSIKPIGKAIKKEII